MNVLTFDLEDWFHILDHPATKTVDNWPSYPSRIQENTERILHALEERKITATFFCLGWAAERNKALVRRIAALGHEIGSHSYGHQLVYEQTALSFGEDLRRSVRIIEDIVGNKVRSYRAPGFSIGAATPWAFDVLCDEGIEIDASIFPAARGHGGFPGFAQHPVLVSCNGARLKEFPVNLSRICGRGIVFSGGGYFRLLPYWHIKLLMSRADYVMTYFHPRDFDASQPMIADLPVGRKFKSYYGLKGAFPKFLRLLDDFRLVSLQRADELVNWTLAPVVEVRPDGSPRTLTAKVMECR